MPPKIHVISMSIKIDFITMPPCNIFAMALGNSYYYYTRYNIVVTIYPCNSCLIALQQLTYSGRSRSLRHDTQRYCCSWSDLPCWHVPCQRSKFFWCHLRSCECVEWRRKRSCGYLLLYNNTFDKKVNHNELFRVKQNINNVAIKDSPDGV